MTQRKSIHHRDYGSRKDLHHGGHRDHGGQKRKVLGFFSLFRAVYSQCPLCSPWFKLFLFALVLSPLSAAAQESKPTVRHHSVRETASETSPEVEQGEAAIQRGDYATAQPLLEKAVAANPDDYLAWFDLGYVYKATNQLDKAIDAYRESIGAEPNVFESNLNLGILLARQGNNAEAAKYLKAATHLKPTAHVDEGLARAWQSLGIVLQDTDPQQALAAFAEAAKLQPNNFEAHFAAGQVLEKQNQLDAAAKEYETSAALDPKSIEPVVALSVVYTKQQKYAQAEMMLRKLLAGDPQNQTVRTQLGRILAAEGKNEEAAKELSGNDGKIPSDPHTALELGTLYVKAGKYAEAEQLFRSAVQKLPQDAEAHYALGSALMQEKKYPEAQQELLMTVKLKPDLGEAYGNLAVVASENKDYQLAIRALDARAKLLPDTPATYFLRATSFDNLKATKQAVDSYKQFLQADAGKQSDMEWQARHRLMALDSTNAKKYEPPK
jgi:Flp pilus assembly protein TadD